MSNWNIVRIIIFHSNKGGCLLHISAFSRELVDFRLFLVWNLLLALFFVKFLEFVSSVLQDRYLENFFYGSSEAGILMKKHVQNLVKDWIKPAFVQGLERIVDYSVDDLLQGFSLERTLEST